MTVGLINWKRVRAKLSSDEWYLLGKNMRYTSVARLQVGLMEGMEDVEVMTRNTHREQGRRHCDVYLRLKEGRG